MKTACLEKMKIDVLLDHCVDTGERIAGPNSGLRGVGSGLRGNLDVIEASERPSNLSEHVK